MKCHWLWAWQRLFRTKLVLSDRRPTKHWLINDVISFVGLVASFFVNERLFVQNGPESGTHCSPALSPSDLSHSHSCHCNAGLVPPLTQLTSANDQLWSVTPQLPVLFLIFCLFFSFSCHRNIRRWCLVFLTLLAIVMFHNSLEFNDVCHSNF